MYINQPIKLRTSLAIPKPTSQSTEHNQTNPNFLLDRNRLKNSLDCTSGHETALTIPPAYDRVTGRREEPVADWFPTRPESNLSSIDSWERSYLICLLDGVHWRCCLQWGGRMHKIIHSNWKGKKYSVVFSSFVTDALISRRRKLI